jgi:hypothetical protein
MAEVSDCLVSFRLRVWTQPCCRPKPAQQPYLAPHTHHTPPQSSKTTVRWALENFYRQGDEVSGGALAAPCASCVRAVRAVRAT